MIKSITTYNFNNNDVRAQNINGELWFCLNDACKILGLKNSSMAISKKDGVSKIYLTDNLGRQQETTFINEPNLYRLIFRSNKPQAQAFADWVYNEVLPSIRKTGSYSVQQSTLNPAIIGGTVKRCVSKAVREELSNLPQNEKFYLCVNMFSQLVDKIKADVYEQARIDERKNITKMLQVLQ